MEEFEKQAEINVSPGQAFFTTNQFQIVPADQLGQTPSDEMELLPYCVTCKILRPPRSYHCRDCGVCIEVHDHHCPWMGTCIGKRNIRYFIMFLKFTAIHALITSILFGFFLVIVSWPFVKDRMDNAEKKEDCPTDGEDCKTEDNFKHNPMFDMIELGMHGICFGILLYCMFLACMLFPFGREIHDQVMQNLTTNEKLRKKWNAKQTNAVNNLITDKQKFRYFYLEKLPTSRIQRYHELKQTALQIAKDQHSIEHSGVGESSLHHPGGGGSINISMGFSFADNEIEPDVHRSIKKIQKDLLKQIDNYELLMSYGIDVEKAFPKSPKKTETRQLNDENPPVSPINSEGEEFAARPLLNS